MENVWFYSRQGTKFGPLSKLQIETLVAAGKLYPEDLLWKSGMKAKFRAGNFKGLFPISTDNRPIIRPETNSEPALALSANPSEAKMLFRESELLDVQTLQSDSNEVSTVAAGEELGGNSVKSDDPTTIEAAEAIRTEIVTIILPHAYRRLGRHVQASVSLASDFPDLFRHLNRSLISLRTLDIVDGEKLAESTTLKREKVLAHRHSLELRIDQIICHLGEEAFAKLGEASGPPNVIQGIVRARLQLSAIDVAISKLRLEQGVTRYLSLRTILFGGIFTALLIALLAFCIHQ